MAPGIAKVSRLAADQGMQTQFRHYLGNGAGVSANVLR